MARAVAPWVVEHTLNLSVGAALLCSWLRYRSVGDRLALGSGLVALYDSAERFVWSESVIRLVSTPRQSRLDALQGAAAALLVGCALLHARVQRPWSLSLRSAVALATYISVLRAIPDWGSSGADTVRARPLRCSSARLSYVVGRSQRSSGAIHPSIHPPGRPPRHPATAL